MLKRYSYRAYPTVGQQRMLARTFGCVRVVFNDFLAERDRLFAAQEHMSVPFKDTARQVTTLAKLTEQRAWLSEVSNTPLQQAVRDADRAYRNWFASLGGRRKGRPVGKPRFKSRRDRRQSARFTNNCGFTVKATTHGVAHVRIPKVGWVRFVLSRELPSTPSSVTVIHEPDGNYRVSFVVDAAPIQDASPTHLGRIAGIDLGLTDLASIIYSDGTREKISNPRHLRARERKLARTQRSLSRKTRGSNNRAKARLHLARQHRKVRDTRNDFHHQLAARLTRENQAVIVEQLNVVGLTRAGATGSRGSGLRKSVADAGWGNLLRILGEKTIEHHRTFIAVNPAYTSQSCSVCGKLDGPKPLHIRTWTCSNCGASLDRDYNAAVNIMVAAGLAETQNACGRNVRQRLASAVAVETGTHRTDNA